MNPFPTTKEFKLRARQHMAGAFGACTVAAFLLVLAGLLLTELLKRSGGAISLYYWPTDTTDIQSSLSLSAEGLFAALRVEEAGMGISVAVTPVMLGKVLGMQLLCALLVAPLRLGCFKQLWAVRRKEPKPTLSLFSAYADIRRGGQAILLEVLLTAIQLILQLIAFVPALLLLQAMGPTLEGVTAAGWTMMLGMVVVWCLMTPFLPARWLLSRDSATTAFGALKAGFALLRGAGGRFLRFRLSFVILELCSVFTNGIFDIYLFPYQGLAAMEWLETREEELRVTV